MAEAMPFLGIFSACVVGEDLEGSALEHLPRGRDSPWIPII